MIFLFGLIVVVASNSPASLPYAKPAVLGSPQFAGWSVLEDLDRSVTATLVRHIWPDATIRTNTNLTFQGFDALETTTDRGQITLIRPTGHYLVESPYTTRVYSPDGVKQHIQINWIQLSRDYLHGGNLSKQGTLVDVIGILMIALGFTGLVSTLNAFSQNRNFGHIKRQKHQT